jgi:hypothetical protein
VPVFDAVFGPAMPLAPMSGDVLAATDDGEMFPHSPDTHSIYHFSINFDEDGGYSSEFCLRVDADIMPGTAKNQVNLKKPGELPVAIYSTAHFDATQVDGDTAVIGGVPADKWSIKDVDGDGVDDIILHWSVPDLIAAGVIDSSTTSLTVEADLEDGSCVIGTDSVSPK